MPIEIPIKLQPLSQKEFADAAYEVMACVFGLHNEIGRFFDERIYKQEIFRRLEGIQLEVPVTVSFEDFRKVYFLDLLIRRGAIFELKVAESLGQQHRAQLLNYLLLCELPHGKLVNVRPETVEHEFVNTSLTRKDRIDFAVDDAAFMPFSKLDQFWREWVIEAVRDWGTGLDVRLYEDAVTHAIGGESHAIRDVDIIIGERKVGAQRVRLSGPEVALKVTTLPEGDLGFELHARRFLDHTSLQAIHWVNINRHMVTFRTLRRK